MMKTDETSVFILKPPHFAAESASDHLLRAFSANGRTWSMQHIEMAGTSRREIQSIEAGAIHAVEHLTGRHIEGLKLSTPTRMDGKSVEIAGQIIHRDHWTTERRRWCPVCWQEDMAADSGQRPKEWNVHRRFWWNVAAIGTCPYHHVRLRDVCPHPECNRPVFSYIGGMHQCRSGHSLLTAEPEFVDPSMTMADAYLLARLTGARYEPVPLLDQLPLGEAIDAITRLGAAVVGGAKITLTGRRSTREVELMAAGFNIAKNWPHAFVEHLETMKANGGGWGSEKTFGQLYRWAKDLGGSVFAEEVRRVFFGCIGQGRYVKPTSRVHAYVSNPVPTLKEVCKELGISSPTAHRYLEALGHPILDSKKGTPTTISGEALDALREAFTDQLDLTSAAKYLGLARTHLRALAEAGRIAPTAIHEAVSRNARYFAKSELDRVQNQLMAGLPILNKGQATKLCLVSITKVAQYGGSGKLPGVLQKLLDGQVRAGGVASWGVGLPRILLTPWALSEPVRRATGHERAVAAE